MTYARGMPFFCIFIVFSAYYAYLGATLCAYMSYLIYFSPLFYAVGASIFKVAFCDLETLHFTQ